MKPSPKDVHEFLEEVLSDLLELFPGVLILVKMEDGSAVVLAGGAGPRGSDDNDKAFAEIIRVAPELIQEWSNEAMADRVRAKKQKTEPGDLN